MDHQKCGEEHCTAHFDCVKSCEMIAASQISEFLVLFFGWLFALYSIATESNEDKTILFLAAMLLLFALWYYFIGLLIIEEKHFAILQNLKRGSRFELSIRVGILCLLVVAISILSKMVRWVQPEVAIYQLLLILYLSMLIWDALVLYFGDTEGMNLVNKFIWFDIVACVFSMLACYGSSSYKGSVLGNAMVSIALVGTIGLMGFSWNKAEDMKEFSLRVFNRRTIK